MNEAAPFVQVRRHQLDNLPIGLFGAVMGLSGLSIAWRLAHQHYGVAAWIGQVVGGLAIASFVLVVLGYGIKLASAPEAVVAEFRHPIASSLFGTFFISLLLLPIILAPISLTLARGIWVLGVIAMLGFAWVIVGRWMGDLQEAAHATPAWIIPVVGLLDVPLAVPSLGLPATVADGAHLLVVLALAVGLFFAVPLFTLIFSRLLFQPPMPEGLHPTLLIMAATFSVGFSAYTIVAQGADLFAQALYMLMLFMLAVLLPQIRHLPRCCPFRFSWWAVSFPLAASAVAALRFAMRHPGWITESVALILLVLASATAVGLLARTLAGLLRGELRTLSG